MLPAEKAGFQAESVVWDATSWCAFPVHTALWVDRTLHGNRSGGRELARHTLKRVGQTASQALDGSQLRKKTTGLMGVGERKGVLLGRSERIRQTNLFYTSEGSDTVQDGEA